MGELSGDSMDTAKISISRKWIEPSSGFTIDVSSPNDDQFFANTYVVGGCAQLSFGGIKHSGHGRKMSLSAMQDVTATKTIGLKHT